MQPIDVPDKIPDRGLDWASEVWKDPFSYNLQEIHEAKSISRFWYGKVKAALRFVTRGSERHKNLKELEDRLEMYILDLKDAEIDTMHKAKMAGE